MFLLIFILYLCVFSPRWLSIKNKNKKNLQKFVNISFYYHWFFSSLYIHLVLFLLCRWIPQMFSVCVCVGMFEKVWECGGWFWVWFLMEAERRICCWYLGCSFMQHLWFWWEMFESDPGKSELWDLLRNCWGEGYFFAKTVPDWIKITKCSDFRLN